MNRATERDLRANGWRVLRDIDQGIQVAIVTDDNKTIRAIVGVNDCRYLPNPTPNPLDELLRGLEGKPIPITG